LIDYENGNTLGSVSWFTRWNNELDGKTNVTQVFYQCMPTNAGGIPFNLNDYNDREVQCILGPVDETLNRADYCRMRVRVKSGD